MKRYLIILTILALSIISCGVEPIRESVNQGIRFNVLLDSNPVTKAEPIGLLSEEGKITAFTLERVPETKSVQINQGSTFTQIYESFQVEGRENGSRKFYDYAQYNSDTGLWDLQNSSYQWRPGHEIEIIAAASGRNNEQFFNGITYNGNPSTASFNYSLPDTHASQQDYLIGYYKGEIANGTVSLKFNHPLTSLVFRVGPLPLGVSLQVNSITLEGIDAEAICDVTFGENTTYTWRDHSGTKDYTQVIENAAPQEEGDDILDETASFIVIPRTFPANSEARILLNITENGREYEVYAPLAGQVWNPGETNIYQISYHGETKAVLIDGPTFNYNLAHITYGTSLNIYELNNRALDGGELIYGSYSYREIPRVKTIRFITQVSEQMLIDQNLITPNSTTVSVNAPGERPIYMNWNNDYGVGIITVYTDDYEIYTGPDASEMFKGLVNLQTIEGLDKLNTKNATSMGAMFAICKKIANINLQSFNTEKVTNMNYMFTGCEAIRSLDLSSFNTNNVTESRWLFAGDNALSNIIFGDNFQMPKSVIMTYMFCNTPMTNLDLSFLLGSEEGTNIHFMFAGCHNLKTVDIKNIRHLNSSLWSLFDNCRYIESINLGGTQTLQDITKFTRMFADAALLNEGKCLIKCSLEAKNTILNASDTEMSMSKFEWNIIPATP